MGYRAHVVTQHRDYGSSVFSNWAKFQSYVGFLYDTYEVDMENMHVNEAEDEYEIPKVVFEKEIKRLENLPSRDETDETLEEAVLLSTLKEALREAVAEDSFVTLEWF